MKKNLFFLLIALNSISYSQPGNNLVHETVNGKRLIKPTIMNLILLVNMNQQDFITTLNIDYPIRDTVMGWISYSTYGMLKCGSQVIQKNMNDKEVCIMFLKSDGTHFDFDYIRNELEPYYIEYDNKNSYIYKLKKDDKNYQITIYKSILTEIATIKFIE